MKVPPSIERLNVIMGYSERHQGRGETRFPGITRHARILGVRREHLWQVLMGQRESAKLLESYASLLKAEGRHIPADLGKGDA